MGGTSDWEVVGASSPRDDAAAGRTPAAPCASPVFTNQGCSDIDDKALDSGSGARNPGGLFRIIVVEFVVVIVVGVGGAAGSSGTSDAARFIPPIHYIRAGDRPRLPAATGKGNLRRRIISVVLQGPFFGPTFCARVAILPGKRRTLELSGRVCYAILRRKTALGSSGRIFYAILRRKRTLGSNG